MATILDLIKEQEKDIYGKVGNVIIDSKGAINPPRGAALLTASPNPIASAVGATVSGIIKGSANRPSDTIFKGPQFYQKPISLGGPIGAKLQNLIQKGDKYFIKQTLSPDISGEISQGLGNPKQAIANRLIKTINSPGSLGDVRSAAESLFRNNDGGTQVYGTKWMKEKKEGKELLKEDKKFSNWYKKNDGTLDKRDGNIFARQIDLSIKDALDIEKISETDVGKSTSNDKKEKDLKESNYVYVKFKRDSDKFSVILPGTLSGLSEDVTSEWTDFRYIGSPFKTYRYTGVERSLKFNLKLYYNTVEQKDIMIKKINFIKSMGFPNETTSTITYGGKANGYAFTPNLIWITIGDLYSNILGIVETLSFTIEDNTVWPSKGQEGSDKLYPSIIDISLGFKIIENHEVETDKFKFNFDGINSDQKYTIK